MALSYLIEILSRHLSIGADEDSEKSKDSRSPGCDSSRAPPEYNLLSLLLSKLALCQGCY
jgi:hypothetical protein